MFQYDEKGVENMLLRIAVCDDEAIHRLIIRDKLDAYAISNDIDLGQPKFKQKNVSALAPYIRTHRTLYQSWNESKLWDCTALNFTHTFSHSI